MLVILFILVVIDGIIQVGYNWCQYSYAGGSQSQSGNDQGDRRGQRRRRRMKKSNKVDFDLCHFWAHCAYNLETRPMEE